jgi:hypothetical protein
MALFAQLSRADIKREFTHYGLFFGFVPVYLNIHDPEPQLLVLNWLPEWLIDVGMFAFNLSLSMHEAMDPTFQNPGFPIKVLRRIPGARL